MTAIPTARVASYVARPDLKTKAFLVHGTDSGLIRESAAALARNLSEAIGGSPDCVRINEDDLESDPDRLAVEIQTLSMFSPQKIIRAKASGRSTQALGRFAWDDIPETVWVIVEAGNLKKDAKLRGVFEKARHLAALACHDNADTERLAQLIRHELSAAGMSIDKEAEQNLVSLLGGDPGVARSEIDKLVTYAHGSQQLTIGDILAVVGDTSRATLDAAVDTFLDGDVSDALRQITRLQAEGIPADVLLYALGQHLVRLLRLRARMNTGATADTALRSFRPPIHFRRADRMKQQIRRWGRSDLLWALDLAARAHQRVRLEPQLGEPIASDLAARFSRIQDRRRTAAR
jgi:DNA polymerase III subunit delta